MTTLTIVGAPLAKTDDQRRAERRARRGQPSSYPSVILARIVLPALLAFGFALHPLALIWTALT